MEYPFYDVEFISDLPDDPLFWAGLTNCLVVIDDLWKRASKMSVIADVFKVYSRKANFSVFITSQYFYEGTQESVVIRNNCSHILAMENVANPSYSITKNPKINKQFKEASRHAYMKPFGYVLITLSPGLMSSFRVSTNLFSEDKDIPFPQFFT